MQHSNYIHLPFQFDPKSLPHRIENLARQAVNIAAAGAAVIDQHEGLVFVHAVIAKSPALPAADFDQPGRRNFDLPFACRILRQGGIGLNKRLVMAAGNDRIFKKTACIADFCGIG